MERGLMFWPPRREARPPEAIPKPVGEVNPVCDIIERDRQCLHAHSVVYPDGQAINSAVPMAGQTAKTMLGEINSWLVRKEGLEPLANRQGNGDDITTK